MELRITQRRENELKGTFYDVTKFKIEKKFSNQELAQKWENEQKNCHPGGPKTEGPVYGYSHNYKRRKPKK